MTRRIKLRFMSVLLTFFFLFSFMLPSALLSEVHAAEEPAVYSAAELAGKAVDFINNSYKSGEKIDGYTAYILTLAGEDLASDKWTSNGKTVKNEIESLADLLGDHNSLMDYITATQNADGSFGPYANAYGTKAPLQALAMVKDDIPLDAAAYNRVQAAIAGVVNYFKTGYQNGAISYDTSGWDFDYRCVEALAQAGEDLSVADWVYHDQSLKDSIITSADVTADVVVTDPSVKDAVYLAKEITALYALDPTSGNIDVLADAIVDKQAEDGSFGAGIYDQVMVLTALGKTDKISHIDQAKAFNYIDNLKQSHQNSWGYAAGVAWGYAAGVEESDLTAQVITALSYFNGANTEGSEVNNLIQSGLIYLADIQDAETAAIPAQWDSTFATAETLIALKSLGNTYNEYAGDESFWVKKSKTKTIAQQILAIGKWNDEQRLNRLANLLIGRQKTADPGKGSFESSVYSDMWGYIALGGAGKIAELNTGDARSYILSKQHADASWGETFPDAAGNPVYYPDFLSTAQAIRSLTYLPGAASDDEIQAAIEQGLAYLKSFQQDDGGIYNPWDDPAVDNSEIVITLHKLGKDPESAEWTNTVDGQNVNPVSYLMNKTTNADGSFGTSKNVFGATQALYAYILENNQGGGAVDPPTPPSSDDQYSVYIAVIGKDGELLYDPGSVVVSKTGEWGLTAMGALHATGLSYVENGGFVTSIAGQANSGMSGWMYKVNNSVPGVMACEQTVYAGDRIIWWYSTDPNASGPTWDSITSGNYMMENITTIDSIIDKANSIQNKLIDGTLKPAEAVVEITGLIAAVKDILASTGTSAADASKAVRYLMENTITALIENKQTTTVQAIAALQSVINDGVKIILARSDAVEVEDELKNSLAAQVRNIITMASTVASSQLTASTSDSTTKLGLPIDLLEQKLAQLGQAQQELADTLSGDRLQDLAVLARNPVQQVLVDFAGAVGQQTSTELTITDDVNRNLRDNGLKLAVRIDDGLTIMISGKKLTSQGTEAMTGIKDYVLLVSQLDAVRTKKLVREAGANSSSHLILRPVSNAYSVTINDLNNENEEVNSPTESLELVMDYAGLAGNPEIAGIYRYENGSFTFAGAKLDKSKGVIGAGVTGGGTFILLEYDKKYTDLAGHWAEGDIQLLSARQIVSGITPDTYGPGQAATRAQCISLLVRALGIPKCDTGHAFADVPDSAWYADDVKAAVKAGLVKGTPANTLSPDQSISRAELAVMISRVLESKTDWQTSDDANKILSKYTDAGQIPDWAREGTAFAVAAGIVNGRTADTIAPKDSINRAEAAVIIGRLLEYME